MGFERIGSEDIWEGKIAKVRVDTFRYDDGEEAEREIVSHPGAVTILPFDGQSIWLVRQPREPVGYLQSPSSAAAARAAPRATASVSRSCVEPVTARGRSVSAHR